MRISLLLQREPFPDILERTMAEFLRDWTGKAHVIKWHDEKPASPKGQLWQCNQYLNAIFAQGVSKKVLEPVFREFSRSVKPWRTPLQKMYVNLATARHTSRWLASAFVEIDPPLAGPEEILILGGNHHLRLLDYRKGCCFVIRKSGFSPAYIGEEIRVRRENPYLPVPRIIAVAHDGSWYSEELIHGTPINRLRDKRMVALPVWEVTPFLFRLYDRTRKAVDAGDYINALIASIRELVAANRRLVSTAEEEELFRDIAMLKEIAASPAGEGRIMVVQTHGDFQPANILLGDRRTWLIDWEYTERRQIVYDILVYILASRYPVGLSGRIARFVADGFKDGGTLLADWPGMDMGTRAERKFMIARFLLEDLHLKLKEIGNPLFRTLDIGYSLFRREMQCAVGLLQERM